MKPGNTKENIYVQDIKFNGKKVNVNFFRQEDMWKGGTIIFKMGPEPQKKRGTEKEDYPYSMSTGNKL